MNNMAGSVSSNASDIAYNIVMNGVPFLFTPINKSASENKRINIGCSFSEVEKSANKNYDIFVIQFVQ
ncbi:UNVERIFIED_CONTAM: hypothetical protein NCL1_36851 [Trichonephila clavipes]